MVNGTAYFLGLSTSVLIICIFVLMDLSNICYLNISFYE